MAENQDATDDAQARLRRNAEAMYARDQASQHLGIELSEVRDGYARMVMTVVPWMVQGLGVCHGGLLFALADTAMAFASNPRGEAHIATGGSVEFLRPAKEGQVLIAEARELQRTRRTAVYDVNVTIEGGKAVCHFRGRTIGAEPARPPNPVEAGTETG